MAGVLLETFHLELRQRQQPFLVNLRKIAGTLGTVKKKSNTDITVVFQLKKFYTVIKDNVEVKQM